MAMRFEHSSEALTKSKSTKKVKSHSHARSHKLLKQILFIPSLLIIVLGILASFDFLDYKHGNRSHLFGTLDTYTQNQTLKFSDFDIWVTEVERWDYCGKNIADFDSSAYVSIFSNSTAWPSGIEPKKNLAIHFFYKNVSTKVVSLNGYRFKPVASSKIYEKDRNIIGGDVLPDASIYGDISFGITKDYYGPLSLVITKDGKKKNIQLSIPTQERCRW